MGYSIRLTNPSTGDTLETVTPHHIYGGTFCLDTTYLELSITYNYSSFYYRKNTLGESTKIYGEQPINGALPVLREEYGGLYSLQRLSIHEAREHVLRAINALKDEDIDEEGNPYDMVTEYEPRILRQIERCKRVATESPYHKTREKARRRAIFYQDYYKRALGYWAPTERNARRALINLLQLLCLAPSNAKIEIN